MGVDNLKCSAAKHWIILYRELLLKVISFHSFIKAVVIELTGFKAWAMMMLNYTLICYRLAKNDFMNKFNEGQILTPPGFEGTVSRDFQTKMDISNPCELLISMAELFCKLLRWLWLWLNAVRDSSESKLSAVRNSADASWTFPWIALIQLIPMIQIEYNMNRPKFFNVLFFQNEKGKKEWVNQD